MRKSHKKWGACIVRVRARGAASIANADPFSAEEGGRGRGYPPYVKIKQRPCKCRANVKPLNLKLNSTHSIINHCRIDTVVIHAPD